VDQSQPLPDDYHPAELTEPLVAQIPKPYRQDREYLSTFLLLDALWPDGRLQPHLAFGPAGARTDFGAILEHCTWSSGELVLLRAAWGFWNGGDDIGVAEAARTLGPANFVRLVAVAHICRADLPSHVIDLQRQSPGLAGPDLGL
jgi:hypothetical protein